MDLTCHGVLSPVEGAVSRLQVSDLFYWVTQLCLLGDMKRKQLVSPFTTASKMFFITMAVVQMLDWNTTSLLSWLFLPFLILRMVRTSENLTLQGPGASVF